MSFIPFTACIFEGLTVNGEVWRQALGGREGAGRRRKEEKENEETTKDLGGMVRKCNLGTNRKEDELLHDKSTDIDKDASVLEE